MQANQPLFCKIKGSTIDAEAGKGRTDGGAIVDRKGRQRASAGYSGCEVTRRHAEGSREKPSRCRTLGPMPEARLRQRKRGG